MWRFLTYIFLHGGPQHITFNLIIQVLVGIPLELSQPGWNGSLRVAGLYLAGTIFGSLGGTVADPSKYLLGASGAVYALIFAHLATLILNWKEDGEVYKQRESEDDFIPMEMNPWIRGARLVFLILFTCMDIGTIIYNVKNSNTVLLSSLDIPNCYFQELVSTEPSKTSYSGHFFGGIAGVMIGIFILKNRKVEDWEVKFQWISFGVFSLLLIVFIVWHLAGGGSYFPFELWGDEPFCS